MPAIMHCRLNIIHTIVFYICYISIYDVIAEFVEGYCKRDGNCVSTSKFVTLPRYILYDVNPPEGFNLRRDVYMRYAVFARKLRKLGDWHLVLPPWGNLYHWQSIDVGKQEMLPWRLFFDVPSLKKFAPVMEMYEFLEEYNSTVIDEVIILQHYKGAFETGNWDERYSFEPCNSPPPYRKREDGIYTSKFWGYKNVTAKTVRCLSFHGHASQLTAVLQQTDARTVMFDHAEVVLHDTFGDGTYWMARRSMRFSRELYDIATAFRKNYLNSMDEQDGTIRPEDWRDEQEKSGTLGGPYLGVHLRRKDFVWGRAKDVPSVYGAAIQIEKLLREQNLQVAFIATDAPHEEVGDLQSYLPKFRLYRYRPPTSVKKTYKDGGIAIIEQIICAHARYFIGSHESTFSFRIQEEREIMGFPAETTFNRLCADNEETCSRPSKWEAVFGLFEDE